MELHDRKQAFTAAQSPPTNGIWRRLHRTIRNELSASAFRRKPYHRPEGVPPDVNVWVESCIAERTQSGKDGRGSTPPRTFIESATLPYDRPPNRIQPASAPVPAVASSASSSDHVLVTTLY